MYSVVGCRDCGALWVVAERPKTTGCPRCGKRHRFRRLKRFVTTDDEDHARQVRAAMLAEKQDHGEAFAALDSFAEMELALDDVGVPDDEYLAAAGIDPDEVAAAGERASEGRTGGSADRKETVLDALRTLDRPTAEDVEAYATERGVPAEYVRDALAKLTRAGEVSESRGRYRLL